MQTQTSVNGRFAVPKTCWWKVCFLGSLILISSCTLTDTRHRDWSQYDGPGAEYFGQTELMHLGTLCDPGEPINRAFGTFNHGMIRGIADPWSQFWRYLMPRPARHALTRMGENLGFPKRFVNNLFQAKLVGAGKELSRFVINTTIGIVGLFDPAGAMGIDESNEDFGQTFAKWGWDSSSFLMIPILGPGSDRDSPAQLLDKAFEVATYIPGGSTFFWLNEFTDEVDKYKRFIRSNYDPYTLTGLLWDLNHRRQYLDFEYDPGGSSDSETVRAIFLTFQDEDFPGDCDDDEVEIPSTGEDLPYTYIMQDEPAPIMYIVPGLGSHRESDMALGLAEMAYKRGFSAVTISSSMNFEFMETASSVDLPGFGPVDAHDTHVALDLIHRQLMEEYPDQITGTALAGLSLGAYHALEIAAANQDPDSTLIEFDHYLPINPPISLMSGVGALDGYYNAPLQWPAEDRTERLADTIMKVLTLADGEVQPTKKMPLSEIEAQFLIGLSFRLNLMFAIHSSQSRHNMGVLLTDLGGVSRGPAYHEIFHYSYMEYFYAFILPYFTENGNDVGDEADLIRLCDLRHVDAQLRKAKNVHVFSTLNDFLLDDQDVLWMRDVFGDEQLTLFDDGGHLGNIYEEEVQDQIMASISALLPAGSAAASE